MSRSSGGRSAVSTIIGTPASSASTIAGCRLAAADPEVQRTAAGLPVASALPRAKNPALRSSRITDTSMSSWRQSATASGVEREPGETTARSTPDRASSSAIAEASAVLRLAESIAANRRSVEPPRRKRVFVDLDAQARPIVDDHPIALGGRSATDRAREESLRRQAVRDPGVRISAQGLNRVGGGRDADRPLERAREIRGHDLGDLQRSSETADLRDLHRRDLARAQLLCTPGVEGRDQALVRGEGDVHAPAHLDHLLEGP